MDKNITGRNQDMTTLGKCGQVWKVWAIMESNLVLSRMSCMNQVLVEFNSLNTK